MDGCPPVSDASNGEDRSAETEADASWSTGGVVQHDTLVVNARSRAGDSVPLWVDVSGHQSTPPRSGFAGMARGLTRGPDFWRPHGGPSAVSKPPE